MKGITVQFKLFRRKTTFLFQNGPLIKILWPFPAFWNHLSFFSPKLSNILAVYLQSFFTSCKKLFWVSHLTISSLLKLLLFETRWDQTGTVVTNKWPHEGRSSNVKELAYEFAKLAIDRQRGTLDEVPIHCPFFPASKHKGVWLLALAFLADGRNVLLVCTLLSSLIKKPAAEPYYVMCFTVTTETVTSN